MGLVNCCQAAEVHKGLQNEPITDTSRANRALDVEAAAPLCIAKADRGGGGVPAVTKGVVNAEFQGPGLPFRD